MLKCIRRMLKDDDAIAACGTCLEQLFGSVGDCFGTCFRGCGSICGK